MDHRLRLAIADDEIDLRVSLASNLKALGHEVVVQAANGRELVERCQAASPQLVLTDLQMPLLDGLAAAAEIYAQRPTPVIVLSEDGAPELLERIQHGSIHGWLAKPLNLAAVVPTMAVALRTFEEVRSLHTEIRELRQNIEERKTIERAKGILMKRGKIDDEEALRRLEKLAAEQHCAVVDAARLIVDVEAPSGPRNPPKT